MRNLKKYSSSILVFAVFAALAIALTLSSGNPFYLLNFCYIGGVLAIGLALFANEVSFARRFTQLAIGLYLLVGLGFIGRENMQIEGFWYLLSLGVFSGATIHYFVAKIAGPLLFGRGFCGYACWTAMVLDFLPYKCGGVSRKNLGWIRYVLFAGSITLVAALIELRLPNMERVMFAAFVIGNLVYYAAGTILAFALEDNRAFCKYLCPVSVIMKPAARFSLARITVDTELCANCGKCLQICPMNVDILNNSRNRENATECFLCMECIRQCPKHALKL